MKCAVGMGKRERKKYMVFLNCSGMSSETNLLAFATSSQPDEYPCSGEIFSPLDSNRGSGVSTV
jgi:hypothetical protein